MLVRRLSEAAEKEFHQLRSHILMDAGELGSRHLSVTWVEVSPGADQALRSHEEAEQVYVVVEGEGDVTVAGDSQRLGRGDLVMVPPATDHNLANPGEGSFALLSIQSPAVSADEFEEVQRAGEQPAYDYDDLDEDQA